MDPFSPRAVGSAYDAVAADYVVAFASDLLRLPLDRAVLDELAGAARRRPGPVLDVGCGPGQVAAHLHQAGVEVVGVDVSPGMLAAARGCSPGLAWAAGDMRALPLRAASCSAAVLFYSVQHVPRSALPHVLRELHRVLREAGHIVIATHLGTGEVFPTELLGHVFEPVGATLYDADELEHEIARGGFAIEQRRRRGPLPHEHPSERIYLTARAVG
jgi:ubiquinone/menaquinone biosynthesis C-methylase UbiE